MIQASMTSGLISHTRTLFLQPFLCRQILLFFSSLQEKLLASNTCLLKLEFPDYWLSKDLRDSKTSVKVLNLRINVLKEFVFIAGCGFTWKIKAIKKQKGIQLSNLWWMPNSVHIGFGAAVKTGSTRQFKRHPTAYKWVSSQLPLTED